MDDEINKEQLDLFPSLIESYRDGKDEMNIVEFPVAVIARAAQPGQLTVSFSDTIRDQSTGKLMDRSVTVHGTETWGLPAAQDDEVLLGLIQLSRLQGWPQTIRFTRYQLVKMLGWAVGGASYQRVYTALHRLTTTSYDYKYAWRDRTDEEWVPSRVFSYIQELEVHEAENPTATGMCTVQWASWFHKSLEAGNLKSLDFDFYRKLKHPIAKRLYRFLDKRFYRRKRVDYQLRTLAEEKLGLARSYKDAAQIKRVLAKPIKELEDGGFIVPADPKDRYINISRGVWKVQFERGGGASTAKPETVEVEVVDVLAARLESLGVSAKRAVGLADSHEEDYIEDKIEILEFLLGSEEHESPRNIGAWLATAISDDYKAPKGFKSRAERLREAEEARKRKEAKKAAMEARKAEEARKEAQKAAEEEEARQRVGEYLEGLESAQRAELEEQSLATIDRSWREKEGVMADMMRENALRDMVLEMLDGRSG